MPCAFSEEETHFDVKFFWNSHRKGTILLNDLGYTLIQKFKVNFIILTGDNKYKQENFRLELVTRI